MISSKEELDVVLIDFGYASKYIDKQNRHLEQKSIEEFSGNLLFSSLD